MVRLPRSQKVTLSIDFSQFSYAQVIAPAFYVANREFSAQGLFQKRNILKKDLFLQVLRARRDDNPLAAVNAGKKVCERFSCACPRFDTEMKTLVDSLGYRLRHLNLSRAELIIGMVAGYQTIGGESFLEILHSEWPALEPISRDKDRCRSAAIICGIPTGQAKTRQSSEPRP